MQIEVISLIGIFTMVNNQIKLVTTTDNLFCIKVDNIIEKLNEEFINKNIKIKKMDLSQCYTFSEVKNNKLIISVMHLGFVNYNDLDVNNFKLLDISVLKDTVFYSKCIDYLKNRLVSCVTMKRLYPNEFTIPEIQKLYENVFNIKIDRRNFRKRLIRQNIIEETGKMSLYTNGRPAKLYIFKDVNQDVSLF